MEKSTTAFADTAPGAPLPRVAASFANAGGTAGRSAGFKNVKKSTFAPLCWYGCNAGVHDRFDEYSVVSSARSTYIPSDFDGIADAVDAASRWRALRASIDGTRATTALSRNHVR